MLKKFCALGLIFSVAACGSPRDELNAVIKGQHFIPFSLPMPSSRVGTVLRGNDSEMFLVAKPERCFPDLPDTQALRWIQNTDLPNQYKKVSFDFNAQIDPVLSGGNSVINFKSTGSFVKTVDIEFKGASIEFLDETAFNDYYQNGMTSQCKTLLSQYPFIGQGLRVEGMSFTFKDQAGASINLTLDLDKIVDIAAGATWALEDNYTLTIATPKYIGYRMAKLSGTGNASQVDYSTSTDSSGNWLFKADAKDLLGKNATGLKAAEHLK